MTCRSVHLPGQPEMQPLRPGAGSHAAGIRHPLVPVRAQGHRRSSEVLFEAVWGEKYLDNNNTVRLTSPASGKDGRTQPQAQVHQNRLGGWLHH